MTKEFKDSHILVVDDEEMLRKIFAFDLKRWGFNVHTAASGNEAFEIVKKQKIDVIVSDVRMPDGTGIELLDNVKNYSPELPIVMFVTGFADISVEDVFDKGADAIFSKPFDRKLVLEAIKKALTDKNEFWSTQLEPQVDSDFQIEINFADLGVAVETKALRIGRGGMFVALTDIFPAVDEKVTFTIKFQHGSPIGVAGRGEVRWVRSHSSPQNPSGCGIEFSYLDEETRSQVVNYILKNPMKSYIPKN